MVGCASRVHTMADHDEFIMPGQMSLDVRLRLTSKGLAPVLIVKPIQRQLDHPAMRSDYELTPS